MRNILIILGAFVVLQNWQLVAAWVAGDIPYDRAVHGEVVLLSTKTCPYCRKTRKYLSMRGVPYTELDVETSRVGARLYSEAGAIGVPVVIVGERTVYGFQPGRIAALFDAPENDPALAPPDEG